MDRAWVFFKKRTRNQEAASYGEGGGKQTGQHLEESKGQLESQADGAMGHCLGSESWTMQKADERRADAFEMWCYRRVLRIPWTERKTNAWVFLIDKIGNRLMLREMVRR